MLDDDSCLETREKYTHCNITRGFLASIRVAHYVHFPCEHSGIGRTLELDLVRTIISFQARLRIRNVGDLDWGHDNAIRLVIGKNDPPVGLAGLRAKT